MRKMEQYTRLDLPLLLPDVDSERDACIDRLVGMLEQRNGVSRVHVVRPGEPDTAAAVSSDGKTVPLVHVSAPGLDRTEGTRTSVAEQPLLCLHYDPERLSLARLLSIAKAAGAEISDRYAHTIIPFRLIGSEDDGARLEEGLSRIPGVLATTVSLASQLARVEYDRERVDRDAIEQALGALGAQPVAGKHERGDEQREEPDPKIAQGKKVEDAHSHERPEPPPDAGWYTRNRELAWSLIAGALLAIGWFLERQYLASWIPVAVFAGSYFFGARDNVSHFIGDLRHGHFRFNIDLLMVVAAIGAAILGEWFEGALLLFLFSLGHAMEHYALGRARNAIKALADIAPQVATVLRDRREQEVPIAEVQVGDKVVVKPAERIPVDGTVAEGRSGVNQAPITGESVPVDKAEGDKVFAGSVNGEGALVIDVSAAIGDRTLDRVIRLVAEAQTQKAPTQQFTDRFERIFVPIVLVGDLALIVVPPLIGFWTWSESFYRAMAMLVAASPCALALGTPAAVLAGIAQAARNGVLIKGGAHLETLGTISVLALDKTGTITKGEPAVTDVVPLEGTEEADLLATAAAVERRSQHPLAKAVLKAAEKRSLTVPEAGDLDSVTGRGIRSHVNGQRVEVGRLLMFEESGANIPPAVRDAVRQLEEAGRTTMVVRRGEGATGGWLGVLGIADEPRADVRETLDALRAAGMKKIVMLTGDNAGVGNAVGTAVGIDEVRAGLLPEDKVTAIKELAAEGQVAMVGDGVNDAPALAHATVGIAMGGAGTAAALETADVALMGDDLGKLPFAVGLSRRARGVIRQNLYVSLAVIGVLLIATVTGIMRIGPAVVIHEGSTLVVIANALRLLAYNQKRREPVTGASRSAPIPAAPSAA